MTEQTLSSQMKRHIELLVEQGWTYEQAELETYDLFIGADERVNERYDIIERNPYE